MDRKGLVLVAAALGLATVVGASCGTGGDLSSDPLPPMHTTSTSTSSLESTTSAQPKLYKVQQGDQLGNIASSFSVSMDDLMTLNGITNPNKIRVGQLLKIPTNTIVVVTALTPRTTLKAPPTTVRKSTSTTKKP
jgi:LysM repeat protein